MVDYCESPPIFLVKNEEDLAQNEAKVSWNLPIFHDNSLKDVVDMTLLINGQLTNQQENYILPIGETTLVKYVAKDQANNEAVCLMEIILQAHHCILPPDPINGHRNCSLSAEAVYCSLSCMDGYAFAMQPSQVQKLHKNATIVIKNIW